MTAALLIILGVAAAGGGGELFVRGSVALAMRMRIAPGIVGATVVAFATSSPELSVGVNSALEGAPEISLGDALGSNVVNVALVLGLALAWPGRPAPRGPQPGPSRGPDRPADHPGPGLRRHHQPHRRADPAGLLRRLAGGHRPPSGPGTRRHRRAARGDRPPADHPRRRAGLALLILAGRLIVLAAQDIGDALGWDTFTVGAVMVAVGTSTPELATTITARLRGHDEVSVGTVLGSNIFNGLLIVGVAAAIAPIRVAGPELRLAIAAGVLSLLLVLPGRSDRLGRGRGVALLLLYAVYLIALLTLHSR